VTDGFGVRGTVPQRISPEGDGKVAISFRPAGVYKDAAWVVRAGDEVLCRRKSRILTPGESQRVEIDRALFRGKDEVIVEVVK
jgi:sarcosine oxidase subunit alpha